MFEITHHEADGMTTVVVSGPPFALPFERKSFKETVFPFLFLPFLPEKRVVLRWTRVYFIIFRHQ